MEQITNIQNDELEVEDNLGEQEALPFVRYSITSYGADYTVDSLVSRIDRGSIFIPKFQRDYVWKPTQASHLIESFLLGLPVPGIFLSKSEDERLLVVDGQQRLRTLQAFYKGAFPDGKPFKLIDVQNEFENKTYETLNDEDRRRLDDSIVRATILQQNSPREDYSSSIYFIFRRLNTNSTPLTPQEIRSAIYDGTLNDLIVNLNGNELWRRIFGKRSNRKRDQELILRFFALYDYGKDYSDFRSMDAFLSRYMQRFEDADIHETSRLDDLFTRNINVISEAVGKNAFRIKGRSFNAAVFDAVMIGTARRLERGPISNLELFRSQYSELIGGTDFIEVVSFATGDANTISKRIQLATDAFRDVD